MFNGCLSLSYLPQINKWDTSNVNIMSSIFSSCPSLVYLPEIDKDNVKEGIRVNGKQNLNQLIEDFE